MKIGSIHYQLFIYNSKVNLKGTAPIYCKLLNDKKVKFISTGININPLHWDGNKYKVSSKDQLNQNLLEIWKHKLYRVLLDQYTNNLTTE